MKNNAVCQKALREGRVIMEFIHDNPNSSAKSVHEATRISLTQVRRRLDDLDESHVLIANNCKAKREGGRIPLLYSLNTKGRNIVCLIRKGAA